MEGLSALRSSQKAPRGVTSLPGVHYAGYTRSKGGVLPQLVHIKCLDESRVGSRGGKGKTRSKPVVQGAFSALRSSQTDPRGEKSLPDAQYAGCTHSKGRVLPQLVHIKCLDGSRVRNRGGNGQKRSKTVTPRGPKGVKTKTRPNWACDDPIGLIL